MPNKEPFTSNSVIETVLLLILVICAAVAAGSCVFFLAKSFLRDAVQAPVALVAPKSTSTKTTIHAPELADHEKVLKLMARDCKNATGNLNQFEGFVINCKYLRLAFNRKETSNYEVRLGQKLIATQSCVATDDPGCDIGALYHSISDRFFKNEKDKDEAKYQRIIFEMMNQGDLSNTEKN